MTLNESSTSGVKILWICIAVSILLHVALALASPKIIAIFKPEIKKIEKSKPKKKVITLIKEERPKKVAKPDQPKPNPQKRKDRKPSQVAKRDTPPVFPEDQKSKPKIAANPEAQAEKKKKKKTVVKRAPSYARTTDAQPTGVPESANFLGERNTVASSNAKTDASAPDRASINGEESKFQETTNSDYQDGDLAHMNKGGQQKIIAPTPPEDSKSPSKIDPEKIADEAVKEAKSNIVESKERGDAFEKKDKKDAREASVLRDEVKDYLKSTDQSLAEATPASALSDVKKKSKKPMDAQKAQVAKNTIANKKVDPNGLKQKAQEEKQRKKSSKPKQASSNNSKKGFRSEAKATRYEGSISRRSKSGSNNVKATPLGQYMAKVSKEVEREWQRRVSMKLDLIQPGSLRMGFILNSRGKVVKIYTLSQTYGSEMNRSITFQAINSAKFPAMPRSVKADQNGDPIEFIYSFAFQ